MRWRAPLFALVLAACGGGGECIDGPVVSLDFQVGTVLPWTRPSPVEGASMCLEEPVECRCARSDARGFGTLRVPIGAEVKLRVEHEGFLPQISQRVTQELDLTLAARMVRPDEFDAMLRLVGRSRDPAMGHVGVGMLPPPGGDSSGFSLSLRSLADGAEYAPLYYENLVPVADATATDAEGVAFFVNVPPGRYLVAADFARCASVESGWPRYDDTGAMTGVEVEVRQGAIAAMSAVQCEGPGAP